MKEFSFTKAIAASERAQFDENAASFKQKSACYGHYAKSTIQI